MTAFTKDNLIQHGAYLTYFPNGPVTHWEDRKFVARFKYASMSSKGTFKTFLIKNFTVEEYFARIAAGDAPLSILESKGYVLSHIKAWLKRDGFPPTQDGYKQWTSTMNVQRFHAENA